VTFRRVFPVKPRHVIAQSVELSTLSKAIKYVEWKKGSEDRRYLLEAWQSYENFISDVHFGGSSNVSRQLRRDPVVLASGAGWRSGHCQTVASTRSYG